MKIPGLKRPIQCFKRPSLYTMGWLQIEERSQTVTAFRDGVFHAWRSQNVHFGKPRVAIFTRQNSVIQERRVAHHLHRLGTTLIGTIEHL